MRILFITPYVPSLIRVRPLYFIKYLAKSHDITLVSLMQGDKGEDEAIEQLRNYCEDIHMIPLNKMKSLLNCFCNIITPTPLQAAFTKSHKVQAQVQEIVSNGNFDILHVEHIRGAQLASNVTGIPKVYDSVDCITKLLKQKMNHQDGILKRMLNAEELVKMRAYEPRIANDFDNIIITSEHDKKALEFLIRRCGLQIEESPESIRDRRIARSFAERLQDARLQSFMLNKPSKISVIRNGVDSEYFKPMDTRADSGTIVFSGRMSYFANSTAVQKFYNEIFPLIRTSKPDARFRIVGSDPPDFIRQLAKDPRVEITGHVPDIRPYLASAEVVVCPLTIGVGIQNKVLEAMSMGKPVVASSIACSGIPEAINGDHLIRADDPVEMANAILTLIDDSSQRQRLGSRACSLVQNNYSWESSVNKLSDLYEYIIDDKQNRLSVAA